MQLPDGKIRFLKWPQKNYTETSQQVGTDDMILDGQTVQRTEVTNSDSTTIYVSKDGDDSDAGTSSAPKLTLDGAIDAITSAKYQIMITDSGIYEPPKAINIEFLSGIYAAEDCYPTIQDSTYHVDVRNNYPTVPVTLDGLKGFAYKGAYYHVYATNATTVEIRRLKYYNYVDSSTPTIETLETVTGLTNADTHMGRPILKDGYLICAMGDEDVVQYDIDNDSLDVTDNIAGVTYTYLAEQQTSDDAVYLLAYDTDHFEIYNINDVTDNFAILATCDSSVVAEIAAADVTDFAYHNGYFYVHSMTKIAYFALKPNGLGSYENSTVTAIDIAHMGDGQFLTLGNNQLGYSSDDGTYLISVGTSTKISSNIYLDIKYTELATYTTKYNLNNYTTYPVIRIKSKNLELLDNGEQISNESFIPYLSVYYNDIVYNVGAYFLKQIQNSLINVGEYTGQTNTKLLLHSNTTNGSTTFNDSSNYGRTLTPVGNTQHSTTQKKFGATSIYFDGSDYMNVGTVADFNAGTEQWWFECWVYMPAIGTQTLFTANDGSSTHELTIRTIAGPKFQILTNGTQAQFNATGWVADTWTHFYICRNYDSLECWVNGVNQTATFGSVDLSAYNLNSITTVNIGRTNFGTAYYYTGYMDEVRFGIGTLPYVTYPSNFTLPTAAYTNPGEASASFPDYGFRTQGIKYDPIYCESAIQVNNDKQLIYPKYCYIEGTYWAFIAKNLALYNNWIENSEWDIYGNNECFLPTATFSGLILNRNLFKNIYSGMYYVEATGVNDADFQYNTFFGYGTFDNFDFPLDLTMIANIMSLPFDTDFGDATVDGTTTEQHTYGEAQLYINSTAVTSISKILFKDILNDDLRMRHPTEGYKITTLGIVLYFAGAYNCYYTLDTTDALAYYDLPVPDEINISFSQEQLVGNKTIASTYVLDNDIPFNCIELVWGDNQELTLEDYESLKAIVQYNNFFEVLLDKTEPITDVIYTYPNTTATAIYSGTVTPLIDDKVVRFSKSGNNYTGTAKYDPTSTVFQIQNVVISNDYYPINFTNPVQNVDLLCGHIAKVEPTDIEYNSIINELYEKSITVLSGFSLKLYIDRDVDFTNIGIY
jgi:hypothetical protein